MYILPYFVIMEFLDRDGEHVFDSKTVEIQRDKHLPARQSYISTVAKYNLSYYEKNILYQLIEIAQQYIKDSSKKGLYYPVELDILDLVRITIPKSALMVKKDAKGKRDAMGYTRIKEALLSLNDKRIEYETDKEWKVIRFIELPNIKDKRVISFCVHKEFWNMILDVSKGVRWVDIQVAKKLSSSACRFYSFVSLQEKPIYFKIEDLKKRLGLEGSYRSVNMFIKKVVESAKEELDKDAPYSFEYKLLCRDGKTEAGKGPGKKAEIIVLLPKKIAKNEDPDMQVQEDEKRHISAKDIGTELYDYIRYTLGISQNSLDVNYDVVIKFSRIPDALEILHKAAPKMSRKRKPIGWIFGVMKNSVKDKNTADGKQKIYSFVGKQTNEPRLAKNQPSSIGSCIENLDANKPKENETRTNSVGKYYAGLPEVEIQANIKEQKAKLKQAGYV